MGIVNTLKRKKGVQLLLAVVMAVLMMTPLPVSAAIASPDTLSITWGGAYRNYLELNDQLYLFTYTIEYGTNPTEGSAYDLFVARVMDGATTLGTTRPYAYFDDGYDYGVGAVYFSAQDVSDLSMGWGASTGYNIRLQGDPFMDWTDSPPPSTTLGTMTSWNDGGDVETTTTNLTTRMRVVAQETESSWNPGTLTLVESIAGIVKLTADGETYFSAVVPYLRIGCPDLFVAGISTPDYDEKIMVNDYYNIGEDIGVSIYGANWYGQTFTATNTYDISGLWLRLYKVGSPGDVTISVRATSGNLPTGADVADGILASTSITNDTGGEWYEMTLDDTAALANGTTYSVVIRAASGDASNYVAWMVDTAGAYTGGRAVSSSNSGVAWAGVDANDTMFINIGENTNTLSFVKQREGFLIGTPFDFTDVAAQFGISRMYVGGFVWYVFSLVIAYLITRRANSYKPVLLVVAMMSPFGGYYGFMNFYVSLLIAAIIGLGAIYVIAWAKSP